MGGRGRSAAEVVLVEGRRSRSRIREVLFRRRDTRSSTSCATTWRWPRARCEAPWPAHRARALSRRDRREFFYSEASAGPRPPWIEVVSPLSVGKEARKKWFHARRALAWLANLACLELHPHPVRAEDLDHPDELRVDLDPVPGVTWPQIREVAHVVEAALRDFGLTGWPKTSGSRGVHVNVRIERRWSFDEVRRAALALAREVERRPAHRPPASGGRKSATVSCSSPTTRTPRTARWPQPIRAADPRCALSAPVSWTSSTTCDPETSRSGPCRALRAMFDRHAGIDDTPGSLDPILEPRHGRARGDGRRPLAAATTGSRSMSPRGWRPHGAACRSTRSSRSGAPGARRTRWPGSSAGRRAHPEAAAHLERPTSGGLDAGRSSPGRASA